MASNNYYGYPHPATAYSSGYMATQNVPTNYSGHNVQSYSTTTRPPTSYDPAFSANSVAANYGYSSRTQHTAAVAYAPNSTQYAANNSGSTLYPPYATNSAPYTNTYNSVVTNYAASALYTQQANVNSVDNASSAIYTSGKASNWNFKKAIKSGKLKSAPKVQQLHYCEVCKISCAGPQTYKEHLDGQRHKKKEAQMKSGANATTNKRNQSVGMSLRCELCDVTCTGNDAYGAHIRGSKHQKVIKLHTKLGKPIPNPDTNSLHSKSIATKVLSNISSLTHQSGKVKILATPKINFMSGGRLQSTGLNESHDTDPSQQQQQQQQQQPQQQHDTLLSTNNNNIQNQLNQNTTAQLQTANVENNQFIDVDKLDSQPVGQDYVEEIKCEDNKSITFYCKLCDCRFNDPNAKEMHLKGRRHRLQFKKKVDPNLIVDIKPSLKQRRIQETKDRRYYHKQREHHYWSDWYPHASSRYGYDARNMLPPPPHANPFPPSSVIPAHYRRGLFSNGSWDDHHILQKHSEISPSESDLDIIHHLVIITERALKLVSDKLTEEDTQSLNIQTVTEEVNEENTESGKEKADNLVNDNDEDKAKSESLVSSGQPTDLDKNEEYHSNRTLKGLMRVGPLAKSLLLVGDKEVDLVVICANRPTRQLLQRIVDHLPKELQSISPSETFKVEMKVQDAGLSVSTIIEPFITVNVAFTSPLVRETNFSEGATPEMIKEPKQMLDRQKCLNALAALRHAKWYQARVVNLHPCPIIIRLIRDLCRRLPTWSKLDLWAVELLCERVISSAGEQLTPGEAFRHILESIASGLILPGGAGLADPCEKDPVDALAGLTRQEREDITSSAQHALRLIVFRQIHKILGVEPMQIRNRKRKLEDNNEDTELDGESDFKKEKKEAFDWTQDDIVASNDANSQQLVNDQTASPTQS